MEIGLLADYIREKLDIQNHDFDIVDVVRNRLNGTIEYFSFADVLKGRREEEIAKVTDESFEIRINETNANTRQRFSIAHELGHLFLHMGFGSDKWRETAIGDSRQRKPGHYASEEEDANEFAAAFLMPKSDFEEAAKKSLKDGRYSLEVIAKQFAVSEDAVLYRGRNLQLWT